MFARMGRGSHSCATRWLRVGGAGRGDAPSRRKLRLPARGVWHKPFRKADVVSFYLADAVSGSPEHFFGSFGLRRLLEICGGENSGRERLDRRALVRSELQSNRGAGGASGCHFFAVPPDYDHRQDFDGTVGHRASDNFVAHLRGRHPF